MLVKLFKDKLHFFYVRSHCKDYSRGDIKINIKSLNKSIFHSLRVKKSDLQKVHVFMIEYFSSLPLNFANVAIFIFFLHCVDFNIARLFQFTFISALFYFCTFFFILNTFGFSTSTEDKSNSESRLHDSIELECKGLAMNQTKLKSK